MADLAAKREEIRTEYADLEPRSQRLMTCVETELKRLLEDKGITLGVPMESRVKTLISVTEKLLERSKNSHVNGLDDLVGIRCILLFRDDLTKLGELILENFDVKNFEDTSARLGADQFGYQSNHYIVQLPVAWLSIPSYSDLGGIRCEIQVRTLSQHIWAAASHKLQYKREQSVPVQLRRSINRVAALLETVDIEFSRFLQERESYVAEIRTKAASRLNAEVVAQALNEFWPSENLDDDENYDLVVSELSEIGVRTPKQLQAFLRKWQTYSLDQDRIFHESSDVQEFEAAGEMDRYARGVYFTHTGLTRIAIAEAIKQGGEG